MMKLKKILMGESPADVLLEMFDSGELEKLEPSLAALRMDIPRGYHHKDNLVHSFKVLSNAIEKETNGPDIVLRTAALFHDVGKPATRKFGAKKSVSFTNHEAVGARMLRKILPKHGYSKSEIDRIAVLVRFHMRSHGFTDNNWTDSAVRRLMTDAETKENMDMLIILFHADATTGNTNKLNSHRKGIKRLSEEVARVRKGDARKALRPALNGYEVMELLGIETGRELGAVMKFLNMDENIHLTKEEATKKVLENFQN